MKSPESFSNTQNIQEEQPQSVAETFNKLDVKNLSEAERKLVISTAQVYLYETFKDQICPEDRPHISEENLARLEEAPSRTFLLDHKEMRQIGKNSGTVGKKVIGGYDGYSRKIMIDIEKMKNPEDLMKTVVHEMCHLVSDPGLRTVIKSKGKGLPIMQRNDALKGEYSTLTSMLDEGATQIITNEVLKKMGYSGESRTYAKQVEFVEKIGDFISTENETGQEAIASAYFKGCPELIRQKFEKSYDKKIYGRTRGDDEFYKNNATGVFVDLLNDFNSYIYHQHDTLKLIQANKEKQKVENVLN